MVVDILLEFGFLFIFSFINLFFFRKLAKKVGLVDKPNERKHHQDNVPLIGGVSITLSLLYFIFNNQHIIEQPHLYSLSILLLVIMGVIDDKHDLSFKIRLFVQASLSIAMMTIAGLNLHFLGDIFTFGPINLGMFGYFVTVIAVIGAINAFNMVDGIDGLLGGLSIVTFGALALIFVLAGKPEASLLCIALVVCMIPYIVMNLGLLGRQRKVFMGDAGSMMIGFSVIWMLLSMTQSEGNEILMRPVTALWLIAIPLMDMTAIMYRRIRRGDSPFRPDREHLHHIFQRLGFSSRQTLVIICGIASLFASFGILGEYFAIPEFIMLALFIILFFSYAYFLNHIWKITAKIREVWVQ